MTISVSMIVRNEGDHLASCLESVKSADEIVIVDTHLPGEPSMEEVARQYTDKYYDDYQWNDNFSEARNKSLERCTGDWIYIIDADEELEPDGIDKIRAAIERLPDIVEVVNVRVVSKRHKEEHWSARLFRNHKGIVWQRPIHNYLSKSAQMNIDIKHYYGYSTAHSKDPDRALRVLRRCVTSGDYIPRELYYLAREYYYRKSYKEAIIYLEWYVKVSQNAGELADAYLMMGWCYNGLRDPGAARESVLKALNINADFTEALNFMAQMSGPNNRAAWERYAKVSTNNNVMFVRGIGKVTK